MRKLSNNDSVKSIPIVVEDKEYKSITEACRAYGKNPAKVRRRLNTGWSIEKAFDLEGNAKENDK